MTISCRVVTVGFLEHACASGGWDLVAKNPGDHQSGSYRGRTVLNRNTIQRLRLTIMVSTITVQ